jgi:hypothetical protein
MKSLICLLLPLLLTPTALAQSRLERAAGLRFPRPPVAPKPPESPPKDQPASSNGGAGGMEGLFYAVYAAVVSPFYVPYSVLRDDLHNVAWFLHYPYENDRPGYLWAPQSSVYDHEGLGGLAVRLSVEDGNDFHGLNRVGGRLFVDTNGRFGLQARGHFYHEDVMPGQTEDLFLGSTEVTFRFAQSDRASFFVGAGARVSDHDRRARCGCNFTYGADFYPVKPLILSLSLDAGNLGSDGVLNVRGTAGLVFDRFEFFAGYDYLLIGSVDLQGALAGLRLWF